MSNKTMLQAFEWYLEPDYQHWNNLKKLVPELKSFNIDMVWLPPAYKEMRFLAENPEDNKTNPDAVHATGYAVYDRYDLGEFPLPEHLTSGRKPTKATKYGTKDEYLKCIKAFHKKNIDVICDIVINHMFGADANEKVSAWKYTDKPGQERKCESGPYEIEAPTSFTFPSRNNAYSDDQWTADDFNAVSFGSEDPDHIFLFEGKQFNQLVDKAKDMGFGNYDYLMGSNIDMANPVTQEKLLRWIEWYLDITEADGLRLDAIKHISYKFMPRLIQAMRIHDQNDFFVVGEYWASDPKYSDTLLKYLDEISNKFSLFDVPLHTALQTASRSNGTFDMRNLFKDSLLTSRPDSTVTFVDNHDTQPGQMLGPDVLSWFKQQAYALILFQEKGVPCIFYGDLYGIPHDHLEPVPLLGKMCQVRKSCAHGAQKYYFLPDLELQELDLSKQSIEEHNNIIRENKRRRQILGYTRAGRGNYKYSGMAVIVTNGEGGSLNMHVNARYKGQEFVNMLDPSDDSVWLDENGNGDFYVKDGQAAVWITKKAYDYLFE